MKYVHVPKAVSTREIAETDYCFSPGRYVRFIPPSAIGGTQFVPLDKVVELSEVSTTIVRAQQYNYAEIGSIAPESGVVRFENRLGHQLSSKKALVVKSGQILISTVRTYRLGIGMVRADLLNMVCSNALMVVCGIKPPWNQLFDMHYLFAVLRTNFFIEQIWSLLNRGVYPRMDRNALHRILIPVPYERSTATKISSLSASKLDKELMIGKRDAQVFSLIEEELSASHSESVKPSHPHISLIKSTGRFDAAIYSPQVQKYDRRIAQYPHGFETPKQLGFHVTTGPSLEIKLLGTRIDSFIERKGFYKLLIPANISNEGTIKRFLWIGTPKILPSLSFGDILIGEAGFKKGRSTVIDTKEAIITNAHGIRVYRSNIDLKRSVFFRCIIDWYRKHGLFDLIAVGGSGGHLSPDYFEYLKIPRFPTEVVEKIYAMYWSNAENAPKLPLDEALVAEHDQWNSGAAVLELSRSIAEVGEELSSCLGLMISGAGSEDPMLGDDIEDLNS